MANRKHFAFSLVELVIVLVILGVIAAIAIPRMTKGAQGAEVRGLVADLAQMRKAIEFYRIEHKNYPTVADIAGQLTVKTNPVGNLGPYLIGIPSLKTGHVIRRAFCSVSAWTRRRQRKR